LISNVNADRRALALVTGIVMLVIGAAFIHHVNEQIGRDEAAFGCDQFGYLRQAQLFQEHPFLRALDTRLDGPIQRTLIEIGLASDFPVSEWRSGIAPHCHLYKSDSGQIILQYPPGTGFLLSFFPRGTQDRPMHIACAALIALATLALLSLVPTVTSAILVGSAGLLCIWTMITLRTGWSVAPSIVTAMAIAGFGTFFLASERTWQRILFATLTGLALGLIVNFRIANVLLISGYAVVMLAEVARRRDRATLLCALAGIVAIVVAMSPTFLA